MAVCRQTASWLTSQFAGNMTDLNNMTKEQLVNRIRQLERQRQEDTRRAVLDPLFVTLNDQITAWATINAKLQRDYDALMRMYMRDQELLALTRTHLNDADYRADALHATIDYFVDHATRYSRQEMLQAVRHVQRVFQLDVENEFAFEFDDDVNFEGLHEVIDLTGSDTEVMSDDSMFD
jgi:hypothetical protein